MQGLIENGTNFYSDSNNIFFIFFSVENSKTRKKICKYMGIRSNFLLLWSCSPQQ